MTVAANIGVVPGLLDWEKDRTGARVDALLALFGLDPGAYREKYPSQLSGGEAQRVGVARALAADPDILLMDEPFGAIDPITRETLQSEFARIQKELKKTIVFVTHDIDEAIRLATRIVILRDGKLVQHDTPEEILTAPADRFVLEFIGTDRALKRLSRLTAGSFMKEARSVEVSSTIEAAAPMVRKYRYIWVTDGQGEVVGWLDEDDLGSPTRSIQQAMTAVSWQGFAVMEDSTLKEALSRMVQQGIRSAPVVNINGRLVGEVRMDEVLDA
jgi:osmoprotectant transport system ATP-binding protein